MDALKNTIRAGIEAVRPSFFSKHPHFNFISAHYMYIVAMVIVGSVLVFASGKGRIDFIDAFFLAAGSSTQAGLNTVDINMLNTVQQVILYLWPWLTNPITINTFVVWLRLYWFEKRFQHIASEARRRRGTISKSKARLNRVDSMDPEKAVNGRKITVMLGGTRTRINNDGTVLGDAPPAASSDQNAAPPANGAPPAAPSRRRSDARLAPTVSRNDSLASTTFKAPPAPSNGATPASYPAPDHIDFVERQRKGDDEVLRIPNPRDVERGMVPKPVRAGEEEEPDATESQAGDEGATPGLPGSLTPIYDARQQAITIQEPERRRVPSMSSLASSSEDSRRPFYASVKSRIPKFLRRGWNKAFSKGGTTSGDSNGILHRRPSLQAMRTAFSREKVDGTPYLSFEPTIGRNSTFPNLTEEQREELGGIEYRSLKTLAVILAVYFWGFMAFGLVGLLPWILNTQPWSAIVSSAGVSRTWWAFFTSSSAFMDLGFTLTPDSMNSFNTATWPLLLMSFLIIIGNTGFPIMLRCMIWVASHLVPVSSGIYEELRFLLDHPRRCFTLLFPSAATWWLFGLLLIMNGLDVMFFIVLDLSAAPVVNLPAGLKVLNGVFEAASTRTAGFSCVNLSELHPAVQFSYMVMMYISVFPIAISVRRTNVYEEKSLGIYSTDTDEQLNQSNQSDLSYVGSHLRRQLSFDLWYIVLGFFILCIAEGPKLMNGEFNQFAVLFEVVSAYGTVGMSLGYPGVNASLCSQFSTIGKLVLVAMMIRGRHRGLPYGLDRAILLPSESLNAREAAEDMERLARRASQNSANAFVSPAGLNAAGSKARSISRDRGSKIFTSLLHPGPPMPHLHVNHSLRSEFEPPMRRSTEPLARTVSAIDSPGVAPEDTDQGMMSASGMSRVTKISSIHTEPGAMRRWASSRLKKVQTSDLA
ncbi:hypothetical protein VTJ83DRAFT_1185 [Remersonia thermophila]|uniref:Potassium transport protein n=1 Tax=Remersonia thermophila TaxID=72144 RepID=A0ABR4DR32_9PEZI